MQIIHLNQNNFRLYPRVYMVQNDTGRELKMVLDDITLAGTETGAVAVKRSDFSYYTIPATLVVADNAFTADITQALTQPGLTECQLKVTAADDTVVSSYTFVIFVQPSTDGVPEEQLGYSIQDLMDAVNTIVHSGGLTPSIKDAILNCFKNVAWINENGESYYESLELALYPPANLDYIDAVFTQGAAVITTEDTLDDLRQYLVVTAYYDDGTSEIVDGYTLSGTLTTGTSTITATYAEKTDDFTVNVIYVDSTIVYELTAPVTQTARNQRIESNVCVTDTDKNFTIRVALTNSNTSGRSRYIASSDNSVNYCVQVNNANDTAASYVGTEVLFTPFSNIDRTKEIRVVYTHVASSGEAKVYMSYTNTSNTLVKENITISHAFSASSATIDFGGVRISSQGVLGTISVADIRTRVMTADEINTFLEGGA